MSDTQTIRDLHDRWISLELSGHPEAVLALCSDDVCWLVPGRGAVVGKHQVQSFLRQNDSMAPAAIEISGLEIEISGTIAVKKANFKTTVVRQGAGLPEQYQGAHIWTLRKSGHDDKWLVTSVSWVVSEQVSDWQAVDSTVSHR